MGYAIHMSSGIMDEAATVRAIILYYKDKETIAKDEADKLIAMTQSPDVENLGLAKAILESKYKILG